MPRNKTRAIEDIDISIALANFWISPLIDQCKLNDIVRRPAVFNEKLPKAMTDEAPGNFIDISIKIKKSHMPPPP